MSAEDAELGVLKILKAIVWFVYSLASAAAIIIGFFFFLLMFDANPDAPFVAFIYEWGAWFIQPFAGMIEPTELPSGGSIAWSALFAIAAYAVLAWIVGWALDSISNRIWRDTHRPVVGQTVVTETHPLEDGGVVARQTTENVVGPAPVDQAEPPSDPGQGA